MVVPVGTCYEEAWRFLIKEEEGELIHGTVESLGRRIDHAWVELPTGYIWEPQTKSYFSIKGFDIAASPIEEHRYTVEEAAIMLSRVGKHGPWTKEEKEQFLKRGNPEGVGLSGLGRMGEVPAVPEVATELDRVAVDLYIERHGREAYERGEIGETLERIAQKAEEYDPVFLSRHPELRGESITVYHDPLRGEDLAVINTQTGEVIEVLSDELRGRLAKLPAVEEVKFGGGNPMKTETQRKSFHERIFGKGSTPPLERLGRGETLNNLLPMSPEEGPPLPRGLRLKWPWKK